MIEFEIGSVPVALAAKVMSKDATWVRAGIISGWLPIGVATRDGEKETFHPKISPPNSPPRAQETLEAPPPTDRWKERCGGGCRVDACPAKGILDQGTHTG